MKKTFFAILLLIFLTSCVSQFEESLWNRQLAKGYAANNLKQQQAYADWLEKNKGQPVKAGYLRLKNFTHATFIVEMIHPDTQQPYHGITLTPFSEGWFPTADNSKKAVIGNDWAIKLTNIAYMAASSLTIINNQAGCVYEQGKAYQDAHGVEQNFWSCQYGVQDRDIEKKYALLTPISINTNSQLVTGSSTNPILDAVAAKPQAALSAPALSAAPAPQKKAQVSSSDKEVVIHESFENKNSEFALVGRKIITDRSTLKGKVKKGKNYIEALSIYSQNYILTDKNRMDWVKNNYPLDITRDFEYEVIFDLSKTRGITTDNKRVYVCQIILGDEDKRQWHERFCITRIDGELKARFASHSYFSKTIPFTKDHIYKLTVKKIDGLFHLYVNGQLMGKSKLEGNKRHWGPNFGVTIPDREIIAIDSFTISYLNNQQSRYVSWKFSEQAGKQTGNLLIGNRTAYNHTYELWDPVIKNKYSKYYVKADSSIYAKDSRYNSLKVTGNWGIKPAGTADSNIKAIHSVAKWDGDIWHLSKGSYAESVRRKKEKIAAQKRLEATPEYQAEQQRKKIAACKSDLKYQQDSLDELIVKMAKPICEDDVEIYFSPSTYRSGNFYEGFKERCINKEVKWLKDAYLKPIKNKISKITNTCNAVGIDISAIQTNTRLALTSLESSYDQRVNQLSAELRRIDENARNKRAAEKRAHEAQMEANFQEWAGRMRGQDYNSFLDSIGHDSSSTGATAQAQKAVRDYAQAQQKQREMQQDYTRILAQIDQKAAAINVPQTRILTPQETCTRDKQKDSRLYWDTRNNKCMIKMYANTLNNMKDIGVAHTDGTSTPNNTIVTKKPSGSSSTESGNNSTEALSGSTGMEAGTIGNKGEECFSIAGTYMEKEKLRPIGTDVGVFGAVVVGHKPIYCAGAKLGLNGRDGYNVISRYLEIRQGAFPICKKGTQWGAFPTLKAAMDATTEQYEGMGGGNCSHYNKWQQ